MNCRPSGWLRQEACCYDSKVRSASARRSNAKDADLSTATLDNANLRFVMKLMAVLLLLLQFSSASEAQAKKSISPKIVSLPQGRITRIASPDRNWTLTFELHGVYKPRQLWIQRSGSSGRTMVREFERSADISWSSDSQHFFVNDASGSGETRCYIYDAITLKSIDVEALVAKAAPKAADYLGADHSCLEVKHWVNSHEVLVKLTAYFSEPPPQRPGFSGTYRVDLNSTVAKVRERYWR